MATSSSVGRVARGLYVFVVTLAALTLDSCGLPQPIDPVYKFPTGKRVLVFVDPRPNQNVPPEFSAELARKISNLLYQFHGTDHVVPQTRIMELRREPQKLASMSISDVAKAADADVVLHVDLIALQVSTISDESLTQGVAQAFVKVVDRDGKRLWPGDMQAGAAVTATVLPAFTESRNSEVVRQQLGEQLASRIARAFVKYDAGEPALSK